MDVVFELLKMYKNNYELMNNIKFKKIQKQHLIENSYSGFYTNCSGKVFNEFVDLGLIENKYVGGLRYIYRPTKKFSRLIDTIRNI